MEYDLFTSIEGLAEQIIGRTGKAYCVDNTESTDGWDIYRFCNITEGQMRKIKGLIGFYRGSIEIRGSEKGEMIWPSRKGFTLEQALDIL